MRRFLCLALAGAMLLCGGCSGTQNAITDVQVQAPEVKAEPALTSAPAQTSSYTMREETVYYPEGSDEKSAQYVLRYSLPAFSGEWAENANAAMLLWEQELLERVKNERLPLADRTEEEEAPYTEVETGVLSAGSYTNVLFTEQVCFGAETEMSQSAIVLDAQGEETNLYAISGQYAPEALLAQQVYNQMEASDPARSMYYGDLTLADIELALDLYNGFYVEEDAYRLLFGRGILADESHGLIEIAIPSSALYPDFVGEMLPKEAYEALLPALGLLARACAAENRSFEGTPDALIYTLFMGMLFADREAQFGLRHVPKEEYEARAAAYFAQLPADLNGGDGTALEDGEYRIPVIAVADYGLRLDECALEGDSLLLHGVLLYGLPGGADWGELSPVTLRLQKSADAPMGYLLTGFA